MKLKTVILAITLPLILASCATNRGVISLKVAEPKIEKTTFNGKSIFIRSVVDKRVFEEHPSEPSTPSLGFGGHTKATPELKKRAVARKRNAYGKALGDIVLKNGLTTETIIKDALRRSFTEMGYKVIEEKSQVTNNTIMLDASIDKFWSWMSPGFWTLGLTSEIDVKLTLENKGVNKKVFVTYEGRFLGASGGNWIEVMDKNLENFNDEVKKVIK